MIQRLSHATLYVLDQDLALDFYVNKLGFEVRMDGKMDNGFRWVTISAKGQPDLQIILMKVDGPNMQPEAAKMIRALLTQGKINGGVLQTSDCPEDLRRAQGQRRRIPFAAPRAVLRSRSRPQRQFRQLV
jgi:hypothetical protein